MKKLATVGLLLLMCLPGTTGEAKFDAAALAARIGPWADEQTFIVAHFNVGKLPPNDVADHLAKLEKLMIVPGRLVKEARAFFEAGARTFTNAKVKSVYALWSLTPARQEPLLVIPLTGGEDKTAVSAWLRQLPGLTVAERDGAVLAGSAAQVKSAQRHARASAELASGFAAAGDTFCQFVARPPPALRRALAETMPPLPKELGDLPWSVLDKGVSWIAHGMDFTPKLKVRLVIQSQDAATAEALHALIGKGFELARSLPELEWLAGDLAKAQAALTPKVEKDQLVLTVDEETMLPLLAPIAARARERAVQNESLNNLKQLALAMHLYHDMHKSFPASASYDAKGKKLLSWRVHVLPYVEHKALYDQFKLDEPWDSEHNRALIEKMPDVYRVPNQKNAEDGKTRYQVPFGKGMMFEGDKGIPIRDVTDGTSNTILIVETTADRAVIWTKPNDFAPDAQGPLAGLVDAKAKGFNAAFADGSVRFLSRDIRLDTLRALFTRKGGEAIGDQ